MKGVQLEMPPIRRISVLRWLRPIIQPERFVSRSIRLSYDEAGRYTKGKSALSLHEKLLHLAGVETGF
jgi:hypothetical protein